MNARARAVRPSKLHIDAMEPASENQHLVPAVTKITGEPAILVIGVPRSSNSGNNVHQISKENLKPRPMSESSESESESASEPEFDPCFGEWLKGRKVRKLFGDAYYSGKVGGFDAEANWYRVEYDDGDMEDLYWHELEEVLVPLDISIPLKDLALQRCYWDKGTVRSGKKRGRSRKDNSTSGNIDIVSGVNDLALVPVKVEYAEQPFATGNKRGRKSKVNPNNTNSAKSGDSLAVTIVKEEAPAAMPHSRRKREVNRQGAMTTAAAERQKRREQQSRIRKPSAI